MKVGAVEDAAASGATFVIVRRGGHRGPARNPRSRYPSCLADEALATSLKGRIAEMEDRLGRLQDRAAKRRQIAKDVMVELDLKR
jgi:hypothetical protein